MKIRPKKRESKLEKSGDMKKENNKFILDSKHYSWEQLHSFQDELKAVLKRRKNPEPEL